MVEIQLMGLSNHESRHNSRNEDIEGTRINEDTPLLYRFPAVQSTQRRPITTIVVSLLMIILLSGIIIGIYLMVLQSRSENILPPVETPLQLVSRAQWDHREITPGLLTLSPHKAKHVIVVQTETRQCHSTESCVELLNDMQNNTTEYHTGLPYNFLISSNGQTYEGLGWRGRSPLFQHSSLALVLAFIGNYTSNPPSLDQVDEAKNLFAESVSRQYLEPSFIVFGRKIKNTPQGLWSAMEQIPQWSNELSV